MSDNMNQRIESMYSKDRMWAWAFVVLLWCTYAYVLYAINPIITDSGIRIALLIGGALVLLYNTASITSMIKHYKEDKEAIYGIDIRHLDEMREQGRR